MLSAFRAPVSNLVNAGNKTGTPDLLFDLRAEYPSPKKVSFLNHSWIIPLNPKP